MAATKKGRNSRALKIHAFVEAYVGPASFVAREAARMAGYTGSDRQLCVRGSELLADPAVGALIKERITAKTGVDEQEVVQLLASHLRVDMGDFVTATGPVQLDLERARAAGNMKLVKKFTQTPTEHGPKLSIELHDAAKAAEQLGRHFGIFKDDEVSANAFIPTMDEMIDGLLALGIGFDRWEPGELRHYQARQRRQVESTVVAPAPAGTGLVKR